MSDERDFEDPVEIDDACITTEGRYKRLAIALNRVERSNFMLTEACAIMQGIFDARKPPPIDDTSDEALAYALERRARELEHNGGADYFASQALRHAARILESGELTPQTVTPGVTGEDSP